MAGKGRPIVEDKRNNQYRVLMNDQEDRMLAYCSQVTGLPKSQIFRKGIEVLYQQIQLNEADAEYDDHVSMKRVIKCPHCGGGNTIDLEDYSTGNYSYERQMGSEIEHSFLITFRIVAEESDISGFLETVREPTGAAVRM